jgi:hypothetical protein
MQRFERESVLAESENHRSDAPFENRAARKTERGAGGGVLNFVTDRNRWKFSVGATDRTPARAITKRKAARQARWTKRAIVGQTVLKKGKTRKLKSVYGDDTCSAGMPNEN